MPKHLHKAAFPKRKRSTETEQSPLHGTVNKQSPANPKENVITQPSGQKGCANIDNTIRKEGTDNSHSTIPELNANENVLYEHLQAIKDLLPRSINEVNNIDQKHPVCHYRKPSNANLMPADEELEDCYDLDSDAKLSTLYMIRTQDGLKDNTMCVNRIDHQMLSTTPIQHFHRPKNFNYSQFTKKAYRLPYSQGMKAIVNSEERVFRVRNSTPLGNEQRSRNVNLPNRITISEPIENNFREVNDDSSVDRCSLPLSPQLTTYQEKSKSFSLPPLHHSTELQSTSNCHDLNVEISRNDIKKLKIDMQTIARLDQSIMAKDVLDDLKTVEQQWKRPHPYKGSRSKSAIRRPLHEPDMISYSTGESGICRRNRRQRKHSSNEIRHTRSRNGQPPIGLLSINFFENRDAVAVPKCHMKSFRYDDLRTDLNHSIIPSGLIRNKLERYLNDEEFLEILKINRESFYKLPKWKQNIKKREVHLF